MAKPTKEEIGWRRIVRNFTPSWFSVNMGTGIVSILIHQLPYTAPPLRYVSIAFFLLNLGLFSVFTLVSVARYVLYPEIWRAMITHPAQSLFLGCFPMALATIINMIVFTCASWGDWAVYLAWGLWWADVVISLACCVTMPFILVHQQKVQLGQLTAGLLLPVVPTVVAAASGGIVAEVLPDPGHAFTTLVVSYIIWGMGLSFSFWILGIYYHRLHLHSLPPREAIVSVFLPVGPFGQGGFAVLQLGRVALELLPQLKPFASLSASLAVNSSGDLHLHGGDVLYVIGVLASLLMWGTGLAWLAFALISIATTQQFPFNMGWWGFTFPIGVLTTCTGLLAKELSSPSFKVVAMIFSVAVFLLWCIVAVRTLLLAITGEMFFAPCLQDLRAKQNQAGGDRTA